MAATSGTPNPSPVSTAPGSGGAGPAFVERPGFGSRLTAVLEKIAQEPYRSGLAQVVRKEFTDNLTGSRFAILAGLVLVTTMASLYVAALTIRSTAAAAQNDDFVFLKLFITSGDQLPSFVQFLALLAPLVGLALGFDAINGEEVRRTLSRLVAQPIHRDAVINGKFVAGILTIGLMLAVLGLLVSGLGLRLIGIPPSGEEVARLLSFFAVTLIYVAFWLALSILFSTIFRQASTSALAGIAVWLFFMLFGTLIAGLVADALVPVSDGAGLTVQMRHETLRLWLQRLSPTYLYTESIIALLTPEVRSLGLLTIADFLGAVPGPLSAGQSLLLIWPHLVLLVGGTCLIFCVSYIIFMRREVRA